ncbi:MAG: FHA domain-containing protein [Myxococcota bacterium]|nr:FHA domain-containing protein [Myxococcota bacterium]
MATKQALILVLEGPNHGDKMSIEQGSCRLVGRHLSESETALIDRDGNRVLDGQANTIVQDLLQEKAPTTSPSTPPSPASFERAPDMIFSDNSISRAHAMVFFDNSGIGIIDLASTNGTQINGQNVNSRQLQSGDSILIGKTKLQVLLLD